LTHVKALVIIALIGVAAFGAVWLADKPGSMVVTFAGYELRTTVAVAAVAVAGIAFALSLLWSAVYWLLHSPGKIRDRRRRRRQERGYRAVSRGMVAVGAGDRRSCAPLRGRSRTAFSGRSPWRFF
jgi:HemY protein